jgi:ectoine hydroxylase-related dioxygenase (phytanoyl-CoA dioxygenase family)
MVTMLREANECAAARRDPDAGYPLTPQQIETYGRTGYLVLPDVVSEAELARIETVFERFIRGEVLGMGRDFCDMSGPYGRAFEDFNLINAVLPRVYDPSLVDNVFERRATSIAVQLIGNDALLDYDQFLAKRPRRPEAVFAWHQDLGYWPSGAPDTLTVTCSLALDDATLENGCLKVVPGSHREPKLRPHRPSSWSAGAELRAEAHTLTLDLLAGDEVVALPVRRGSVTVHNERIVHGSSGNVSDGWRRTYVIAHRSRQTVEYERSIGFSHSHNDRINWLTNLEALDASAAPRTTIG